MGIIAGISAECNLFFHFYYRFVTFLFVKNFCKLYISTNFNHYFAFFSQTGFQFGNNYDICLQFDFFIDFPNLR